MDKPVVAVSLKMYFDRRRTLDYCTGIAAWALGSGGDALRDVDTAVLPDFLSLDAATKIFESTPVRVGAQDLCAEDRGPHTGEVSGFDLSALGVSCVEVGHAERRTLYGETDAVVAAKTHAALRNGLVPMLCVGEKEQGDPEVVARDVVAQVQAALAGAAPESMVWIAYEPWWAIGAPEPAPSAYVVDVCTAIKQGLTGVTSQARLLYGGSAGPGLATGLGRAVDGLFLGRFAHDPGAFIEVVEEVRALWRPNLLPRTARPDHEA